MRKVIRPGLLAVLAVTVATAGIILAAGIATADNVNNDVTVGGTDTIAAGGSTTVNYNIVATNASGPGGDGQNGCNAADGSAATVTINAPAEVVATPGSLTFTTCQQGGGLAQGVVFSSNTPGDYEITVSVSDSGPGGYNTNSATFTLHVTGVVGPPPDTTPPDISYVLNPASPDGSNGWYKSNVTLTWTVTENESSSSLVKVGCVDQNITADQVATTYSCSATSDGGSAGPVEVSIKRDATPPVVAVTGVTNGATYTLGSVPAAGCDTQDAPSGVATFATASTSGGPVGKVTTTCSGATDNAGNAAADVTATYTVEYDWDGYFRPIDNPTTVNVAKAGSAIPVKFSLSGDQSLNIFGAGSPSSHKIDCSSQADLDNIEQTVNAGGSSLSYDATADQYNYVWKTDKAWAGTCRMLTVTLNDGTTHTALFKFTK